MFLKQAVCTLALAVAITSPATAQSNDTTQQRLDSKIAGVYQAYKRTHDLPTGMLVHVRGPQGTWTTTTHLEGADARTHYRIASVSKTFTAAAVMLLHQRGQLRITDTVDDPMPQRKRRYLPRNAAYDIPYRQAITIRQLLSHRAGVFDLWNDPVPDDAPVPYAGQFYLSYRMQQSGLDTQFSVDDLALALSQSRATFGPPDTVYHYSDTGYNLLVKIVPRVTGRPFERFIRTEFLKPMGLKDTTVVTDAYDTSLPKPFMTGWARYVGTPWLPSVPFNMSSQVGPGSIISTPADVARWMQRLLDGSGPLRPATVRTMTQVPAGNTTYALGISTTRFGMGHSGAHPGYVNIVEYDAKTAVTVVVVTPFIDFSAPLQDHLTLLQDSVDQAQRVVTR